MVDGHAVRGPRAGGRFAGSGDRSRPRCASSRPAARPCCSSTCRSTSAVRGPRAARRHPRAAARRDAGRERRAAPRWTARGARHRRGVRRGRPAGAPVVDLGARLRGAAPALRLADRPDRPGGVPADRVPAAGDRLRAPARARDAGLVALDVGHHPAGARRARGRVPRDVRDRPPAGADARALDHLRRSRPVARDREGRARATSTTRSTCARATSSGELAGSFNHMARGLTPADRASRRRRRGSRRSCASRARSR